MLLALSMGLGLVGFSFAASGITNRKWERILMGYWDTTTSVPATANLAPGSPGVQKGDNSRNPNAQVPIPNQQTGKAPTVVT